MMNQILMEMNENVSNFCYGFIKLL